MDEYVLREFVCKECAHSVVVNPNLPLDYMPNICKQCYDDVVQPKLDKNAVALAQKAAELLKLIGV